MHIALVSNGLAREFKKENLSNLVVYDDVDGKPRYIFDFSKLIPELEAIHPERAIDDANTAQVFMDKLKSGEVNKKIMVRMEELVELLKQPGEVVVLVRTNAVIRKLEKELLKRKVPMRYFNFISDDDIKSFKKGDVNAHLRGKLNNFKGHFENDAQVIAFIERFKSSPKFVTTIHKSKGREFDECVVINSIAPDVLKECNIYDKLGKKRLERISFTDKDEESRNIHYVAVSRSKHKLNFMIYE
jgi:superfamily I DNA/RNA helicase